jgi:hypothetical protein
MTTETVFRSIERHCREEAKAYKNYEPPLKSMTGAKGEARGVLYAFGEIKQMCRMLRRQERKENGK